MGKQGSKQDGGGRTAKEASKGGGQKRQALPGGSVALASGEVPSVRVLFFYLDIFHGNIVANSSVFFVADWCSAIKWWGR